MVVRLRWRSRHSDAPERSRDLNRLDPRNPLVIDTRELGRRPGSMRKAVRTVPAPAELGNPVLGVPEGSDLVVDFRLESVVEGVLVTGSAHAVVSGECVRCLDGIRTSLDAPFQELYFYPDVEVAGEDAAETPRLDGDLLDVEQALRDAVVLALPAAPVCRDDCPGLCADCGARLADDPGHQHRGADLRWAALHGMFESTIANTSNEER